MVLRKKPVCIDLPIPRTRHEEMYAALLLFQPWINEVDDLGEAAADEGKCFEMFLAVEDNCTLVKEELNRMVRRSWLD